MKFAIVVVLAFLVFGFHRTITASDTIISSPVNGQVVNANEVVEFNFSNPDTVISVISYGSNKSGVFFGCTYAYPQYSCFYQAPSKSGTYQLYAWVNDSRGEDRIRVRVK